MIEIDKLLAMKMYKKIQKQFLYLKNYKKL